MANIRKRNKKWHVSIRNKYHSHIYKTFLSKQDADRYALETERQIQKGIYEDLSEASQITLADVLKRYLFETLPKLKSIVTYKYVVKKLLRYPICKLTLIKLTSINIGLFINDLTKEMSKSTANRYLSLIKSVLNIAIKEYGIYLPKNPAQNIKKFKEPAPRDRRLTDDEYRRLLLAASKSELHCLKNIIIFCVESTARRGEALRLSYNDINFLKSTALLKDTKNGENRTIPLSPLAISVLKEQMKVPSPNGCIFPIKSVSQFMHYWKKCRKMANLNDVPFHTTRHEGISRLFERGYFITDVQRFSGHKDLKSLQGYIHIQTDYLVEKLKTEYLAKKMT